MRVISAPLQLLGNTNCDALRKGKWQTRCFDSVFLLPCHCGMLFNANSAACEGRRSNTVNDRSLSSLLELLLRGGIRQMEGQTGGQSATPKNGWNIDERDGRRRKGGMTYSSGTVSLNLQQWQHPDRQVQSNAELCLAASVWVKGMGITVIMIRIMCIVRKTSAASLALSRKRVTASLVSLKSAQLSERRECKENSGTALEQIHCCLCLAMWLLWMAYFKGILNGKKIEKVEHFPTGASSLGFEKWVCLYCWQNSPHIFPLWAAV